MYLDFDEQNQANTCRTPEFSESHPFLGLKSTFRTLWVLFAIVLVGTAVLVGSYFATPMIQFASNFNRLSGMNYLQTISNAGLPSGFTLQMTLTGSVYTVLNFAGFSFSAYYAGEVKRVNRSQIMAMLGATGIFAVILVAVYSSAYYSVGSDFLNAASFLSSGGSSHYTLPSVPVLNFLVLFANPNPLIIVLVGLGFLASCAGSIILSSFITVRNVFAWSFDRIFPSWFTNLDSKRGAPYVAVTAAWIMGILSAFLYVYTLFESYILYSSVMTFITFALVSAAAIWFPFRRKDIFSTSPSLVQKKIAGFPLISLLGLIGLIVSLALTYSAIQPSFTPPPTGSVLVEDVAYSFVPLTVIVCIVIYFAAYAYRKSKGIDLNLLFKEIPPE